MGGVARFATTPPTAAIRADMPYLVYLLTLCLIAGVVLLFNGHWLGGALLLLLTVMMTRRVARRPAAGARGTPADSD